MKHTALARNLVILVTVVNCCAAFADEKTPWPSRPKSTGVLREASTTKFPFPLEFAADDMVLGPRYLYVKQAQALVVVDRETGHEVAIQSLYRGDEYAMGIKSLTTDGELRIIVTRPDSVSVLELGDPARPTEQMEFRQPCGKFGSITPFPSGRYAIAAGFKCVGIVDLRTGELSGQRFFPPATSVAGVAVGGSPSMPVAAVHTIHSLTTRHDFFVYDLSDLSQWRLLSSWPGYNYGTGEYQQWRRALYVDRSGTLVIDGWDAYSIHRAQTGELVGSVPASFNDANASAFTDVGDTRVLSVGDSAGVKLWDLAEPSAPRLISEIAGAAGSDQMSAESLRRRLTASRDEPYLYYALPETNEVRVVDVRDGRIAGRWQATSGTVQSVVLSAVGSSRDVAVFGDRELANRHTQADIVSFASLGSPAAQSRFVHEGVCGIGWVLPLSGRYVAVSDDAAPLVTLVDATTGRVLSTMNYAFGARETGILGAGASSVVLFNFTERASRQLVVENDRWVAKPLITVDWPAWPYGAKLHVAPDGGIVQFVLKYDWNCNFYDCNVAEALRVITPDGRTAQTPLFAGLGGAREVFYSPDGNKAIVNQSRFYQSWGFGVVDFTDRAAPRSDWSHGAYADAPRFVHGDQAVFSPVLARDNSSVQGLLYDANTGSVLGTSATFGSNFLQLYDSKTLPFGSGSSERALWSHWQQGTVLFDVSTNTPQVMAIWDTRVFDPPMLPRDGRSMYLMTPYYDSNDLWSIDTDAGVSWLGDAPIDGAKLVRPGFIVGRSGYTRLSVIRDTSLNHAPVANAGAPQTLECAGPGGTAARLDGGRSSDADSAPGTQDDIASYAWSVDGATIGNESAVETRVSAGRHVATLRVVDLLDASDTDDVAIDVVDTLAPTVGLTLAPVVEGARFSRGWLATSTATDQCDGALTAAGRLVLEPQVLAAPVAFESARSESIDVLRGAAGLRVVLRGPDERAIRARWAEAVGGHGLRYRLDQPAVLDLSRLRPPGSSASLMSSASPMSGASLIARYQLAADGVVSEATAWGAGADHVVRARATDAAGHAAVADASLRRTIEGLCASAPRSVSCVGLP